MSGAALRYVPLVFLAIAWELAPRLHLIDASALPPLSAVARSWIELLRDGDLSFNGFSSLLNLTYGLVGAIIVGVALGVMMAWYPNVDLFATPLVRMTYPMPKSALIPVMILWFGLGAGSKIAAVFMGCLLPVVLSAYNGARGVEQTLIWSARALGASNWQVLREIVVPGAMPEILAGIRNALALSFILLVAAELLVGQRGMGYLISFLGDGGVYDGMFASVLTVSAFGFFADRFYLLFMRWMLQWRE
jgi:NitT/TauT family transport system permease protein